MTQDDLKGEEDVAQKKAALMEKRLRREKEMQMKKQQQEADIEQKKEAARYEKHHKQHNTRIENDMIAENKATQSKIAQLIHHVMFPEINIH